MDKLCLWLERKGQLYYRHKKAPGGAVGNAFMDLNSILQPTVQHIIEVKQNEVRLAQSKSNVPGKLIE
ncbi:MAG: hypothetical protein KBD25_00615 [Rickettsiaceae bacterium]|nr:hypothetical protein [Rickettsiaceae bacterium]